MTTTTLYLLARRGLIACVCGAVTVVVFELTSLLLEVLRRALQTLSVSDA